MKMSESKKTVWYVAIAVALLLIAAFITPGRITPSAFLDQGEPFFPDFSDPNNAVTLEVAEFDQTTGSPRMFKVTFANGRWTIPSHHNYPADGKDRLSKTAAGVIDIKKDDFRSDNVVDHEACGVLDPADVTLTTLAGRGQRVILKGENAKTLSDFIIGNPVENRPGFRFVRVPGQKRVYAVRMDIDISTKFEDWIETDLLQVESDNIDRITLLDYSIDERSRRLNQRDKLILSKRDKYWMANKITAGNEVDSAGIEQLLKSIDELNIVGVRPKPEGLMQNLKQAEGGGGISPTSRMMLQSKGYYFTGDGSLVSNEGELQVHTTDGVLYILRFGEVLYGSGMAITAGSEEEQGQDQGSENRYLFVTAEFDKKNFPEPKPAEAFDFQSKPDSLWTDGDREQSKLFEDHKKWELDIANGRQQSDKLNARFADWYYVISSESFENLRKQRKDMVIKK